MKRIPWNKGKKGLQIAWNKGLTKEMDLRVKRYASKLSNYRKGIKLSEEHKRNIGKSIKGRQAPNKGVPISEETRKKISKALSGKNNPAYGKKWSKQRRRNFSISQIGFDILKFKKDIIMNYLQGQSSDKIGQKFDIYGTTILKYLKKWKVPIRETVYGIKDHIISNDGHKVRSYHELQIDNFFFENGIKHEIEKTFNLKYKYFKSDFYLPDLNLYIEYWGIYNSESYLKRKRRKLEMYKQLGLDLLSIEWNEDPIRKLKLLIPLCAKKQSTLFSFDKTH